MTAGAAETILRALARPGSTIADPATEMSYQDAAAAVAEIVAVLDRQNIAASDCLAFACRNDLPSAIALLALLASGRTFLLLPDAASPAGGATNAAIPEAFCRYRLDVPEAQKPAVSPIALTVNPRSRANLPQGPASFLVPTSGSTARAKLVQHRHDRLLLAAAGCVERLGLVAADRVGISVPIAHMFGLGAAFIPAILAGASIDLQPNANALRFLARERQFNPSVAYLAPSFAEGIARLRRAPRHYRLTVMAGDRLTADLFDRTERLHGPVVNLYGSTELGVIAAGDPSDLVSRRRAAIGRLMPGVAIRPAADPALADLLWLQHDHGFIGYVDAEGQTLCEQDGSLASSELFCTKDVGRLIDGHLVVYGRGDDLVNRDGLLTACSDVAAAIRNLPGIADAAVLAGGMSYRGRVLVAFCVPEADARMDIAAMRKACLDTLAPRAIPDEFHILGELPRLPSGKIDRMELRRRHLPGGSDIDADIR